MEEHRKEESVIEEVADELHSHDSSSSSSDSEDEKKSSIKGKVYRLFGREKPMHKVLGGGMPADLFMWKDKKVSAIVLGVATAIWVLFDVLEFHVLTFICFGLILVFALLCLWSNATTFITKSPPRIPEVNIPEDTLLKFVSYLRIEINRGFGVLRDIALERDVNKSMKVITRLFVLSFVVTLSDFLTVLYTITILLFTVPLFYDKYEDQVDALAEKAMAGLKNYIAVKDAELLNIPREPLKGKKRE